MLRPLMRSFWTGLFFFIFVQAGIAQINQITEEDVNEQTAYIDALSPSMIGEEEEAIKRLESFVEAHPTRHAAYFQLARLYKSQSLERECLNAIEKAVTLNPDNEWYLYVQAQYQEDFSHWVRAGKTFEQLMQLKPDHSNYWLSAAHAFLNAGDPYKSLGILDELEAKVGLEPQISRKKFLIYKSLGKYAEAESEMQKLIDRYPKRSEYLMILAGLYAEMGKDEEELDLYQKVLALDSSNAEAKIRIGELKSVSEGELLTQMLPVVKDPESSIDLKVQKLVPFLQKVDADDKKESRQLITALKALVDAHPRDAKAYTMLADGYFNTGQLRKSLEYYNKAEEIQPNIATVWMQHLQTLTLLDEHKEVLDLTERALAYFPNQIEFYLKAAEAALNLDRVETAREYLESSSFMVGRKQVFKQKFDAIAAIVGHEKDREAQPESYILDQVGYEYIVPGSALFLLEHHEVTNKEWFNKVMGQAKGPMKNDYLAQIAAAYAAFEQSDYEEAQLFLDHSLSLGASNDPRIFLLKLEIQKIENDVKGIKSTRQKLSNMGYSIKSDEG